MNDRRLFLLLVVALAILGLLTLVFNWPPRLQDLLPNFTAEIAGILVTVLFVDWILRRREAERWRIADAQIRADFAATALRFITRATIFLTEAGWNAPEAKEATHGKPWSFVLEHITLPEVQSSMSRSEQDDMAALAEGIHECVDELVQQHTRFSTRLSPEDADSILQLEGHLRGLETELNLLKDDANLMDLLADDAGLPGLEDLTARHLQIASAELHGAITDSLTLFARAIPSPK